MSQKKDKEPKNRIIPKRYRDLVFSNFNKQISLTDSIDKKNGLAMKKLVSPQNQNLTERNQSYTPRDIKSNLTDRQHYNERQSLVEKPQYVESKPQVKPKQNITNFPQNYQKSYEPQSLTERSNVFRQNNTPSPQVKNQFKVNEQKQISTDFSNQSQKLSMYTSLTTRHSIDQKIKSFADTKHQEKLQKTLLSESTKCSLKRNGIVHAYAANTNQGILRNYNEDRVAIILNIMKPSYRENESWPRCSFFGVYDGHGGSACADFLRDQLHQFVIKDQNFPHNPREALKQGFQQCERKFIEQACFQQKVVERSGSCAVVVLIVGNFCYVANVGDSRAILSAENGQQVIPLTRDHKPSDEMENRRIIEAGGQIYQSQPPQLKQLGSAEGLLSPHCAIQSP